MTFDTANQTVHQVQAQWHFPIMTKFGYHPENTTAVGFVRVYKYVHPVTGHAFSLHTGASADYWLDLTTPNTGNNYWGDLVPYLTALEQKLPNPSTPVLLCNDAHGNPIKFGEQYTYAGGNIGGSVRDTYVYTGVIFKSTPAGRVTMRISVGKRIVGESEIDIAGTAGRPMSIWPELLFPFQPKSTT